MPTERAAPSGRGTPRDWGHIAAAAALLVALGLAATYSVTRAPWWDEGLYADVARQFAQHGELRSPLMHDPGSFGASRVPRMSERAYWTTPLYPVALGLWFKALGVGLMQMRALSVLLAAGLVAAWGYIVRALTGSRPLALAAMALVALDSHVLWGASIGRPEVLSSGLATLAAVAYLRWRERRLTRAAAAAAALLAAGALAHPLAAVEAAGLTALALHLDGRRIRVRHAAAALAAGLAVLAPWGLYILQDPDTFRAQWAANMAGRDVSGPLGHLLADVRDRYLHHHFTAVHGVTRARVLGLLALVASVGAALALPAARRRPGSAGLALFAAASWAALAVLDGSHYVQYFYHVFPAYVAVAAVGLAALARRGGLGRVAALGLAAVLVAPGMAGILQRALQNPYKSEYLPVVQAVRAHRAPGAVVVGGSELAFGLGFDSGLVDDMELRRRADVYVQGELYLTDNDGAWQRRARGELARDFTPVLQNARFKVFVRKPPAGGRACCTALPGAAVGGPPHRERAATGAARVHTHAGA